MHTIVVLVSTLWLAEKNVSATGDKNASDDILGELFLPHLWLRASRPILLLVWILVEAA